MITIWPLMASWPPRAACLKFRATKVHFYRSGSLTVEVLKIVLLRPDPVPDYESVRTREVGHCS